MLVISDKSGRLSLCVYTWPHTLLCYNFYLIKNMVGHETRKTNEN